jgi:hypothetical protein
VIVFASCNFQPAMPRRSIAHRFPAMPGYILYAATCTERGVAKRYVGIAGVRKGCSARAALLERRSWHLKERVAWFRGCDMATLSLRLLNSGLSLQQALADEALETARLAAEKGKAHVRGGPWCRRTLPADDVKEMLAVGSCRGRSAVAALVKEWPTGSLAHHIQGLPFKASVGGPAKCILPVKRRSGRSGASSPSRRSGVSGHVARTRKRMEYGSVGYDLAKYGQQPKEVRNKAQRKYRAMVQRHQ